MSAYLTDCDPGDEVLTRVHGDYLAAMSAACAGMADLARQMKPPPLDRSDPQAVSAAVLDLLGELTARERAGVLAHFCPRCAYPVRGCHCKERA